jgi:hypothetical protein
MSKLDRLFEASQKEYEDDKQANMNNDTRQDDGISLVQTSHSDEFIDVAPPEYLSPASPVKFLVYSLDELDQTLHQIERSPRDMIQVSDQAIDLLLEKWTDWREVRERRHNKDPGGRYIPSAQN